MSIFINRCMEPFHIKADSISPFGPYHQTVQNYQGYNLTEIPIVSIPVGIGGIVVSTVELVAGIIVALA